MTLQAAGKRVLCAVCESGAGAGIEFAGALRLGEQAVKRDAAQADDDAKIGEQGDLVVEPGGAVAQFFGGRLVAGRGAARDGGDP